jgi:hypothetical protein
MSWDVQSWMRLICHPVDFVGAAYRKKIQLPNGELGMSYAVEFLPPDENGERQRQRSRDGAAGGEAPSAGFLRITRKAVQMMINECDVPVYPTNAATGKTLTIHRLFANDWTASGLPGLGERGLHVLRPLALDRRQGVVRSGNALERTQAKVDEIVAARAA